MIEEPCPQCSGYGCSDCNNTGLMSEWLMKTAEERGEIIVTTKDTIVQQGQDSDG